MKRHQVPANTSDPRNISLWRIGSKVQCGLKKYKQNRSPPLVEGAPRAFPSPGHAPTTGVPCVSLSPLLPDCHPQCRGDAVRAHAHRRPQPLIPNVWDFKCPVISRTSTTPMSTSLQLNPQRILKCLEPLSSGTRVLSRYISQKFTYMRVTCFRAFIFHLYCFLCSLLVFIFYIFPPWFLERSVY